MHPHNFAEAGRMMFGNEFHRFRRNPGIIKSALKGAAIGAAAGGAAFIYRKTYNFLFFTKL
jgi:hypothetical protein